MKGRLLLRLGLLLLVAGLLTPVLKEFVRDVVVLPFLYAVWVGRLIFGSVPQGFLWTLFLVLALLVAGRSLLKKGAGRSKSRDSRTRYRGRIEGWARLIERASEENYVRWQLARQFRKLLLAMLAHQQRRQLPELRQAVQRGELELPPDVRAYLQASLTSFSHFAPFRFRFWSRTPRVSPLDLDPEQVIHFLEDYLDR